LAPHRPRSLPTSFAAVSRHAVPEIASLPTSQSRLRRIREAQRGS
jgi:hypothetical protein